MPRPNPKFLLREFGAGEVSLETPGRVEHPGRAPEPGQVPQSQESLASADLGFIPTLGDASSWATTPEQINRGRSCPCPHQAGGHRLRFWGLFNFHWRCAKSQFLIAQKRVDPGGE